MTFTTITGLLPPLPEDGATGDDFNDPALAFFVAMRDDFAPALDDLADEFSAFVNGALSATSSTSLTVGTGDKAFTVGTGLAFSTGQSAIAASLAHPTDYMIGRVKTYTGGVLTIAVTAVSGNGNGPWTDWQIGLLPDASVPVGKLPIDSNSSARAITAADVGKTVLNTTGGWSIPSNASVPIEVESVIYLYNDSGSAQSVTITSDTLRLTGTTVTGTRTIGARSLGMLYKIKSTEWLLSGVGVS